VDLLGLIVTVSFQMFRMHFKNAFLLVRTFADLHICIISYALNLFYSVLYYTWGWYKRWGGASIVQNTVLQD